MTDFIVEIDEDGYEHIVIVERDCVVCTSNIAGEYVCSNCDEALSDDLDI